MARSTICTICNTRPALPMAQRTSADMPYCEPCSTQADWENVHSDQAHDLVLAADEAGKKVSVKGWTNMKTRAEVDAYVDEQLRPEMEQCWVCHPELDETQREYTPRRGTSRLGMIINVPQRAPGQEKAATLLGRISQGIALPGADGPVTESDVKISTRKGITTLKLHDFTCAWDEQGRWFYGMTSYVDDKGRTRRIRNAAEFLRLVGAGGAALVDVSAK